MRLAVAPLAARVAPLQAESLMSLVARAAQANVFPRLSSLLSHAGVTSHPAFTPFTAADHVEPLAELLGVDVEEITTRMHLPTKDAPKGVVAWAGVRIERRWIEAKIRRVAPGALMDGPHHRMVWSHRALSFCPESFERLVSSCYACGRTLGWVATHGLDRCEHCRASLLESEPDYVDHRLHARLRAATNLISPDAAVRRRAQSALPAEFLFWDPGELFTALLELGVAWEHPGEGRGSRAAQALSEPRLGLITPTHIASGVEVLQGWPDSFAGLVGRIWREAKLADPNASAALRKLGLLRRHFDGPQPDSDYHRLLTSHIVEAAAACGLPVKRGSLAHLAPTPSVETLSMVQAQDLFGLSDTVLKRLIPDGDCLVSARLGRGGEVRFDKARLVESACTYRFTGRPEVVAWRLGIPAYCLPAFVEAGLLRSITDADARRMARTELAYDLSSLHQLETKILKRKRREGNSDARLTTLIAGRFCPKVWAKMFKALATGKVIIDDLRGTGPLSRRLWVDRDSAEGVLNKLTDEAALEGATVTAGEAGLLLGLSDVYVPELIASGALAAERHQRAWRVKLRDVISFQAEFELSPAVGDAALGRSVANRTRALLPPDFSTRHLSVWSRR